MSDDDIGRLRFDHDKVTRHSERYEEGRAAREVLSRKAQSVLAENPGRDPIGILEKQHASRLPDLVPLRVHRMLQSPFAFYRGSAALQAADLGAEPDSGFNVVLCGDAHIANFGIYASPQRSLVFDLNDFDEAAVGPWEWDVKRLVTSVIIAGRENEFTEEQIDTAARTAASVYRTALRQTLELTAIDRYFLHAEVRKGSSRFGAGTQRIIDKAIKAAQNRTSERVISKIMARGDDGAMHMVENPPTLMHVEPEIEAQLAEVMERYRSTVPPDVALLLSQFTITDAVRRVVGVGSVGTRCYIGVLTGPLGEPLVLQFKEAAQSVIHEFGNVPVIATPGVDPEQLSSKHGYRVVTHQRTLQAVSDPFLGHLTGELGRSFYVRQFRDRNVSFEIASLDPQQFTDYANACASLLARAHAQSPAAASISGYLGRSSRFDESVVAWGNAYADRSYADYLLLRDTVESGRFVSSESGL